MKPIYFILAVLASVTIIAMSTQQIYAPRNCGGCSEFKKLTNEFEKDVLEAAVDDPNIIPSLVDQYSQDVKELFREPSTSP